MGDTQPAVSVLRHGRDPHESRAGPSGRSTALPTMPSLATTTANQLGLLAVPAGWENCTSNHNIPRLLLLACLISLVFLALQFTVSASDADQCGPRPVYTAALLSALPHRP